MKRDKWTMIVVLATGLMCAGSAPAGDLTPPGVPGSTMHTLEEIYQRQVVLDARLDTIEQQTASPIPVGMVLIPACAFVMGDAFDPEGYGQELPVHTNTVSAFYMDATEVTKAKWDEVYDWAVTNGYSFNNAGSGKATNHPVERVNWYDCVKWANARSEMDGLSPCYLAEATTGTVYRAGVVAPTCDWYANGYRLPTEAEWEKAARGGAPGTRFPWTGVDTILHARANYRANGSAYSYDVSSYTDYTYHPDYDSVPQPYTSPVGSFVPNGYGLYDMAGNLYEWCWDWYSGSYYASSPGTDPRGPAADSDRVHRGGAYTSYAFDCRVACRRYDSPDFEGSYLGFRLVKAAP